MLPTMCEISTGRVLFLKTLFKMTTLKNIRQLNLADVTQMLLGKNMKYFRHDIRIALYNSMVHDVTWSAAYPITSFLCMMLISLLECVLYLEKS